MCMCIPVAFHTKTSEESQIDQVIIQLAVRSIRLILANNIYEVMVCLNIFNIQGVISSLFLQKFLINLTVYKNKSAL